MSITRLYFWFPLCFRLVRRGGQAVSLMMTAGNFSHNPILNPYQTFWEPEDTEVNHAVISGMIDGVLTNRAGVFRAMEQQFDHDLNESLKGAKDDDQRKKIETKIRERRAGKSGGIPHQDLIPQLRKVLGKAPLYSWRCRFEFNERYGHRTASGALLVTALVYVRDGAKLIRAFVPGEGICDALYIKSSDVEYQVTGEGEIEPRKGTDPVYKSTTAWKDRWRSVPGPSGADLGYKEANTAGHIPVVGQALEEDVRERQCAFTRIITCDDVGVCATDPSDVSAINTLKEGEANLQRILQWKYRVGQLADNLLTQSNTLMDALARFKAPVALSKLTLDYLIYLRHYANVEFAADERLADGTPRLVGGGVGRFSAETWRQTWQLGMLELAARAMHNKVADELSETRFAKEWKTTVGVRDSIVKELRGLLIAEDGTSNATLWVSEYVKWCEVNGYPSHEFVDELYQTVAAAMDVLMVHEPENVGHKSVLEILTAKEEFESVSLPGAAGEVAKLLAASLNAKQEKAPKTTDLVVSGLGYLGQALVNTPGPDSLTVLYAKAVTILKILKMTRSGATVTPEDSRKVIESLQKMGNRWLSEADYKKYTKLLQENKLHEARNLLTDKYAQLTPGRPRSPAVRFVPLAFAGAFAAAATFLSFMTLSDEIKNNTVSVRTVVDVASGSTSLVGTAALYLQLKGVLHNVPKGAAILGLVPPVAALLAVIGGLSTAGEAWRWGDRGGVFMSGASVIGGGLVLLGLWTKARVLGTLGSAALQAAAAYAIYMAVKNYAEEKGYVKYKLSFLLIRELADSIRGCKVPVEQVVGGVYRGRVFETNPEEIAKLTTGTAVISNQFSSRSLDLADKYWSSEVEASVEQFYQTWSAVSEAQVPDFWESKKNYTKDLHVFEFFAADELTQVRKCLKRLGFPDDMLTRLSTASSTPMP